MSVVMESHVRLEDFVHILCWVRSTLQLHVFVAVLIFVCSLISKLPLMIKICLCEFGYFVIWHVLLNSP